MTNKAFFQKFYTTKNGSFRVINLCDALAAPTLPKSVFQAFASELHREVLAAPHTSDPNDLFEAVASRAGPTVGKKYETKGPQARHLRCRYLATTVDASFLDRGFSASSRSRFGTLLGHVARFSTASDNTQRDRIEDEIFNYIERRSSDPDGLLEVEFGSALKGPTPDRIIWLTSKGVASYRESDVWNARANWSERADRVRDILGLDHFGSHHDPSSPGYKPTLLATLVIPLTSIPPTQFFFRPTPLDGAGRRFRSVFGDLRKAPNSWGRTADLERILSSRPHRGGRELITTNFLPTGPIFFTILGYTRVPRSDWLPVNDAEFLKCLQRTRPLDKFAERLEGYAAP